jgi:hypothetical protein
VPHSLFFHCALAWGMYAQRLQPNKSEAFALLRAKCLPVAIIKHLLAQLCEDCECTNAATPAGTAFPRSSRRQNIHAPIKGRGKDVG